MDVCVCVCACVDLCVWMCYDSYRRSLCVENVCVCVGAAHVRAGMCVCVCVRACVRVCVFVRVTQLYATTLR